MSEGQELQKIDAVRVGEYWVVEYDVCHSRRSCHDTLHVVEPPSALRYPRSRTAAVFLKPGQRALVLYRQWSFNGNLKWNSLCLYEARDNGMYQLCFGYNEWSSVDEIVRQAKAAYMLLKNSGIEKWYELLRQWWKPAQDDLEVSIEEVIS